MREQPLRFGDGGRLAGILTRPADRSRAALPGVVFLTAGLLHRPGPYRLYVDLARTLGAMGFPALRFDLAGIGESRRRDAAADAESAAIDDVRRALDTLATETGADRFVLVGLCSGAELAHRTAVTDERVTGIVALDGFVPRTRSYYLHHYLPRILSLRKWLSFIRSGLRRRFATLRARAGAAAPDDIGRAFWSSPPVDREQLATEFRRLSRRGVRQLQVFSGGAGDCSYARQFHDAFGDVDFGDTLTVRFLPESDHMYVLSCDRRALIRLVTRWLGRTFLGERTATDSGPGARAARNTHPVLSTESNRAAHLADRRHLE